MSESKSTAAKLPITVLGAGSWGTALAMHCCQLGHPTRLWGRDPQCIAQMRAHGFNPRYLQEHPLPAALNLFDDLVAALRGAKLVLLAVPSHAMRELARQIVAAPLSREESLWIAASKGIEAQSLCTPVEILQQELGSQAQVGALGGPSFAREVAQALPTAVVVACPQASCAVAVQHALAGRNLRLYSSRDLIGVELGGALKNVVALAAGVCDGAKLGHNARAALITRGLAEMQRLALALGAEADTLWGLAGVGDLLLTCTGGESRNRRVGLALGQGRALPEILAELGMVAEGVKTTQSARALAQREKVDMPIVETTHAILFEGLGVDEALKKLMERALRPEI